MIDMLVLDLIGPRLVGSNNQCLATRSLGAHFQIIWLKSNSKLEFMDVTSKFQIAYEDAIADSEKDFYIACIAVRCHLVIILVCQIIFSH